MPTAAASAAAPGHDELAPPVFCVPGPGRLVPPDAEQPVRHDGQDAGPPSGVLQLDDGGPQSQRHVTAKDTLPRARMSL